MAVTCPRLKVPIHPQPIRVQHICLHPQHFGFTSLNGVCPESGWPRLVYAVSDLSGWNKKDISGCSTARSCISCPCCMSGWAVPASVLPPPVPKPRPSGSASGWGFPLPPTDYSPCERESKQHSGSSFTRTCISYLMCCRHVLRYQS